MTSQNREKPTERRSLMRSLGRTGAIFGTRYTPRTANGNGLDRGAIGRVRARLQDCGDESRGELVASEAASWLRDYYLDLPLAGRRDFLKLLARELGTDEDAAVVFCQSIVDATVPADRTRFVRELRERLAPPWLGVLLRFNKLPGGTKFLVSLRADALSFVASEPVIAPLEQDLKALLAGWFDPGLLELRRITWDSPASLLESLARLEAVHAVSSWTDMKNRLDADRRVFAFFHPQLPDEALVFVEIALTNGLPAAIAPLLDPDGPAVAPREADTAVFYAISNGQPGLVGIKFGGPLLEQVVTALSVEFPRLRTFATLSPIPGFRAWVERALGHDGHLAPAPGLEQLRKLLPEGTIELVALADSGPLSAFEPYREPLMRLCAHYLVACKRHDGGARDPVANFHLGNGARIERINWLADTSANGIEESMGLMVNYRYRRSEIARNCMAYIRDRVVIAGPAVVKLGAGS